MGLEQLKRSLDEKMNPNCLKDAGILKKNKKPLMERCRRRKINNYLDELKYLVLSALNKEVALYNKMEKADILDMAVKYIKAIRTHPEASTTSNPQVHENSTSLARNYEIPSPTPLQPRTANITYDNSCQRPKEIVGRTRDSPSNEEGNKIDTQTTCKDARTKRNEQFDIFRNENRRNEQHIPKSDKPAISQINANTKIWRPW